MSTSSEAPASTAARSVHLVRARLAEAGLDDDLAAAYALLSLHGAMRAAVLADRLGWPRSKSYRILEAMQHDGLVVASLDRPIEFSAVAPEELFRRLDDRHRARVDELQQVRQDLMPVLQGWHEQQDSQLRVGGRFRILKGERVVGRTVLDLFDAAKESVCVNEGEGGAPGGPDISQELERLASTINVRRVAAEGVPPFVLVDGRELVAGLQAPGTTRARESAYLWTDADGVLRAYQRLFEQVAPERMTV